MMYVHYTRPICGIYSCHTTQHTTQIPPTPPLHPYPQQRWRQRRQWRCRGRRSFERDCRWDKIRTTSWSAPCTRTRGRTCQGFCWDLCWRWIAEEEETWGGGGGRGGIQRGTGSACSTTTTTTTNTMTRRMGRGHVRERTMGGNLTMMVAMLSTGCPLAAWGIGHQASAPTPPPPSLMTTMTMIAATVGGRCAPPPPVHPVPPDAACHCQCRQPRSTAAAWGHLGCGHMRGGGGGGQCLCTCSSGSESTRGRWWGEEELRDFGGITWQTMSGWGRRRRRRCAARATATTTMATREGGGEGEGSRGRDLLSRPCHGS